MSIRVLVVDDEPLARVGITTRLSAYSDMLVVGECSTGEEAQVKIPQVSPDLIFVDVAKALAFAQGKARSWGGDPLRFVLMGHAAGAHLVDLLAADPAIAFHEGAKPWLGAVSLDTATLDIEETMRRRHYGFYDAAFGKDPEYWAETSPTHRLKAAPKPMLLVCSARRPDHPCLQAQRFAAKVASLGGQSDCAP